MSERPAVYEVPLTGDYKLVVIHEATKVYLRLRACMDGKWGFVTPPLLLTAQQILALTQELERNQHAPVTLEHERMDGPLNLMIYRDRLHVHFHRSQVNGSAFALKKAIAPTLY